MPDGRPVHEYALSNGRGMVLHALSLGGIVTRLHVPDRLGNPGEVTLTLDSVEAYLTRSPFLGCLVGRVANRISGARFRLDGAEHALNANAGTDHLHGGPNGYDKRLWTATPSADGAAARLRLDLLDPDGAEGYPGAVRVSVLYSVDVEGTWRIEYEATCDRPTPLNLTHHVYFNLRDAGAGDVGGHALRIDADAYTPTDAGLRPTGEVRAVDGMPMDFRAPRPIGQRLREIDAVPQGYDHNFVLRGPPGAMRHAATVVEPQSGRRLDLRTTQPCVQLYTGNFLDGSLQTPGGATLRQHHGFCLETQGHPDAVNRPEFPGVILRPGQVYRHATEHRFGVEP